MFGRMDGKQSLYRKIVIPIYAMIAVIVIIFTCVSCIFIIILQNRNNMKMAEQSMIYVYKNVSQQLYNINSFLYYISANQEIENILEKNSNEIADIANGNIQIQLIMDRVSFLTLAADFDGSNPAKISYNTSILIDENSSLYPIAISDFTAGTGLYKSDSVEKQQWYLKLMQKQSGPVWWSDELNGRKTIYSAIKKISIRDGRNLGVIVAALAMDNIESLLNQSVINNEGYFILVDEDFKAIYSSSKNPGSSDFPEYADKLVDNDGTLLLSIDSKQNIVMYNTFKNGWKLVSIVPEGTVKGYTERIIAIAYFVAVLCILIAGYITKKTTNRVTKPIKDIVNIMEKVDMEKFVETVTEKSSIHEIRQLYNGYNTMLDKIDKLINDVYIKDIQEKQTQLNLLQSQINPHFLYNTMDIINCMAISRGANDISYVVLSLANVFRYGLNKGKHFILLSEEMKQVASYIDIQKIMNPGLTAEYMIDETLTNLYVINLIIQPLVENAIIHGFRNMTDCCMIWISVRRGSENSIVLSVKDNGNGTEADKMNDMLKDASKNKTYGFGVYNVNKRIKLFFGEGYGLHYLSVEYGTHVEIYLPILKEKPDEE